MDTLLNIKAFLATAKAGNFSEAARQTGVAPSVMAKRIDQLEWKIQGRLFTRSTRKLTLTDLGERHLATLGQLVQDLEQALAGMARPGDQVEGHVRIKLPTTLGVLHLGPLLARYLAAHPRISMDVVLADRSVNPAEEGFDIAIGARPELYGRVLDTPLCRLPRVVCAAPAYLAARGAPQHPRELADHDCLVLTTSGQQWDFDSGGTHIRMEVRPRLRTHESQTLLAAAVAGNGIALLARYAAQPDLARGTLLPVLPAYSVPDVWLKAMVPENRSALPRIQNLLVWLKAELATGALEGLLPA